MVTRALVIFYAVMTGCAVVGAARVAAGPGVGAGLGAAVARPVGGRGSVEEVGGSKGIVVGLGKGQRG